MMMDAKKQTLRQIMDLMDEHRLGKFKKKGAAPAADLTVVEIDAEPASKEPEADEFDGDAKQALMDLYCKDDDEADRPAHVNAAP